MVLQESWSKAFLGKIWFDIIKILGETVKATKKWPTLTKDLVPAGITEKVLFLQFAEKPQKR